MRSSSNAAVNGTRGGLPTFNPLGPWVETPDEIADVQSPQLTGQDCLKFLVTL